MNLGPYEPDTVHCGDAAVLIAALPDECIDLTVTSPPYDLTDYDENGCLVTYPRKGLRDYNGYTWDFTAVAGQLYRVTKQGGVAVWVVGEQVIDGGESGSALRQALYFMSLGFRKHQTIIYEKAGSSYPDKTRYYQVFEYMFIFSKGRPKTINLIADRKNKWLQPWGGQTIRRKDGSLKKVKQGKSSEFGVRFNIWRINNGKGFTAEEEYAHEHPAIFPETLARDHILSWSDPGDVVLDPMAGSGTVPKIAEVLRRRWLAFDISAEYCELIRRRTTHKAFENGAAVYDPNDYSDLFKNHNEEVVKA